MSKGVQKIQVPGIAKAFDVFCDDITGDFPWIVIQRRVSRRVDFNRSWEDFKKGFGDVNGDYFIGLEAIHRLTSTQPYELYVYLEAFNGVLGFAQYTYLKVADERQGYRLINLGKFSGTVVDALSASVDKMFSTYDRDYDSVYNKHLAREAGSAWWYPRTPAAW
ncbi:hypothetical protein KR222_010342 [Zaprionus bogoriensis]|nr:hypothetical protein KR222_010342 [Zaprionus bogoriensis]